MWYRKLLTVESSVLLRSKTSLLREGADDANLCDNDGPESQQKNEPKRTNHLSHTYFAVSRNAPWINSDR